LFCVTTLGDGTAHEVLNGILDATNGESPSCTFAIIPSGTGDDFARSVGLLFPEISDQKQKYEEIVKILASTGKVIKIDVGSVDPTPFEGKQKHREWYLNESSFGFSADVIQSVNEQTKFWISKDFTFQSKSLTMQFTYQNKEIELTFLDKNDSVIAQHTGIHQLCAVSNGQYFGAGMQINPGALANDGEFNVCAFGDVNAWNIMWIIPNVYKVIHILTISYKFRVPMEPMKRFPSINVPNYAQMLPMMQKCMSKLMVKCLVHCLQSLFAIVANYHLLCQKDLPNFTPHPNKLIS
jgi:diacylglycerol kinase (ATP)